MGKIIAMFIRMPLSHCIQTFSGHRDVAELLLRSNANRECRTKTGITPLFQVSKFLFCYAAETKNSKLPNYKHYAVSQFYDELHMQIN